MQRVLLFMILLLASRPLTGGAMLPVIERNGEAHVSAARLERDAGIAIKRLPGQKHLAACSGDRCGLVKEFVGDGSDLLVGVASLAKALDAKAHFDATRQKVRFEFSSADTVAASATGRVGQLAPNFRVRKLDGTWVALSDFRGKRVLINSWASW